MTLESADFRHYHVRRDLTNARDAAKTEEEAGRYQLLLNQLGELEKSDDPQQRADLAKLIERQMRLVAAAA